MPDPSRKLPSGLRRVLCTLGVLALIPLALTFHSWWAPSRKARLHLVQDMDHGGAFRSQDIELRNLKMPSGSIPREAREESEVLVSGMEAGEFATTLPRSISIDDELMTRGRVLFGIHCSPCHGLDGSGDGPVGRRVANGTPDIGTEWTPPANLLRREGGADAPVRQPLGRLFATITEGLRTMPIDRHRLDPRERWSIVAYLRALQRSQDARAGDVPEAILVQLDEQPEIWIPAPGESVTHEHENPHDRRSAAESIPIEAPVAGDGSSPWHGYLFAFTFFLSLGLGALFFVILHHLTGATWSVALRRPAELVALTLVPLSVLGIPLLLPGVQEVLHGSETGWLQRIAFPAGKMERLLFSLLFWILSTLFFSLHSLKQDRDGADRHTRLMERLAGPAMVLLAVTMTIFACDHLMDLGDGFTSGIFGIILFAGSVCASLALLTIVAVRRLRQDDAGISVEHLHVLGTLSFTFICFWAYAGFCQHLLIAYAHLPDEIAWLARRSQGTAWPVLTTVLIIGHLVIPFALLLTRDGKRRAGIAITAAILILLMHGLDLYHVIMPSVRASAMPTSSDAGLFLGMGIFFIGCLAILFRRTARVPSRDPRFAASLRVRSE